MVTTARGACPTRRTIYVIALLALGIITALISAALVLYIILINRINGLFTGDCGPLPTAPLTFPVAPAKHAGADTAALLQQLAPFAKVTYNMTCSSGTAWIPVGVTMTRKLPRNGGFVLHDGSALLVAFRGTFNFADTLIDLNTRGTSTAWFPAEMKLHRGFAKRYEQMRRDIQAHVRTVQPDTVFVTGHSLGAALGILCLADLARTTATSRLCGALFACPKVGNRAFSEGAFEGAEERVVLGVARNKMDAVPLMPPGIDQQYFHVPGGVSPQGRGGVCYHTFYHDGGSWSKNHHLTMYAASVATMPPLRSRKCRPH
jgi:triacylglycerol lipase